MECCNCGKKIYFGDTYWTSIASSIPEKENIFCSKECLISGMEIVDLINLDEEDVEEKEDYLDGFDQLKERELLES